MEPIVYKDSPLAQYLEGIGEADNAWPLVESTINSIAPNDSIDSFAPQGLPKSKSISRRKPPQPLNLEEHSSKGLVAQIHNSCSSAFHSRLGWTENGHFLEKFRYIIVASQLLSDIQKNRYRQASPLPTAKLACQSKVEDCASYSWWGLLLTSVIAFGLAWLIRWLRNATWEYLSGWRISLVLAAFTTAAIFLCAYLRRRRLHYLRMHAVEGASLITSSAQSFDAVTSAAMTLIQEVELVSRGYRISNPLPPVTRLEDQSQTKRCLRLRKSLHRALGSMLSPHYEAYQNLRTMAVELDLEKYYDVYEISRTDMYEAAEFAIADLVDSEEGESLQALRIGLQKLHVIRKLFLCSLLALDADGGEPDFPRWEAAIGTMRHLSAETAKMTDTIDEILQEEESSSVPPTPKMPLTHSQQRMRLQMRKLSSLSQGIRGLHRGLQAKIHLLRDESDKILETDDDISPPDLLLQYDSVGEDLKSLLQEWELGRASLVSNIDRNEKRRSLSLSGGKAIPLSPNSSLGGQTVFEGSPPNALYPFSGLSSISRSRSGSTATNSSSGEEIFEAVAIPRQRSTLTREERLAKMREERVRQAIVRGKQEANTHMLKELEMVIKLRPRGRTTGRMSDPVQ